MSCAREFIEQLYPSDEVILWGELRNYADEESIFILGPGQDIEEVIHLISKNDIGKIEKLIELKKISKPTVDQMAKWSRSPSQLFKFLLVDPYVIIQEFSPQLH
jgi:hypothetical protein